MIPVLVFLNTLKWLQAPNLRRLGSAPSGSTKELVLADGFAGRPAMGQSKGANRGES
jgi:hypothetical protein